MQSWIKVKKGGTEKESISNYQINQYSNDVNGMSLIKEFTLNKKIVA